MITIKQLAEKHDMNQSELCRLVGISEALMSYRSKTGYLVKEEKSCFLFQCPNKDNVQFVTYKHNKAPLLSNVTTITEFLDKANMKPHELAKSAGISRQQLWNRINEDWLMCDLGKSYEFHSGTNANKIIRNVKNG